MVSHDGRYGAVGTGAVCQACRAADVHLRCLGACRRSCADAPVARYRHHAARQRPAARRARQRAQAAARRCGGPAACAGRAGAGAARRGGFAHRERLAAGRRRGRRSALLAAPHRSGQRRREPPPRPRQARASCGRLCRHRGHLGGDCRRPARAGLGVAPRLRHSGGAGAAPDHAGAVHRRLAQDRPVGRVVRGADAPGRERLARLRAGGGAGLRDRVGRDHHGGRGDAVLAVCRQRAPARGGGVPAAPLHVADLPGREPGRLRRCAGGSARRAGAGWCAQPAAGHRVQRRFVPDARGGRAVVPSRCRPVDRQPPARAAPGRACRQPAPQPDGDAMAGAGGAAGRRDVARHADHARQRRRRFAPCGDDVAAAGGSPLPDGGGAPARQLAPAPADGTHVAVCGAAQAVLHRAAAARHLDRVRRAGAARGATRWWR